MKIALFGINFGVAADLDAMIRIARAAESAGLESLWTGEHVVLPDPAGAAVAVAAARRRSSIPPSRSRHVAAHTTRIRLGTGIIILPQRNPLVLAKELATVDVVSRGRLIFGLGAGYLEPEFRALGAPFEQRGAVTDEAIEVLKALWTMEKPQYRGRFFSFAGIAAEPRPVQQPHPPIVVGGRTRGAARRAARYGDGWYGFLDRSREDRADARLDSRVRRARRPAGRARRRRAVGDAARSPTRETVARYAEVGVERLIFWTGRRVGRRHAALRRHARRRSSARSSASRSRRGSDGRRGGLLENGRRASRRDLRPA